MKLRFVVFRPPVDNFIIDRILTIKILYLVTITYMYFEWLAEAHVWD